MLKIKQTAIIRDTIDGAICDCCKTDLSNSVIEMQEYHIIEISGGYGSVFGDGARLRGVFCQQCIKDRLGSFFQDVEEDDPDEEPYIATHKVVTKFVYNPEYGDNRICKCGHPYYRHFDSHDGNSATGCKYCSCYGFEESEDKEEYDPKGETKFG